MLLAFVCLILALTVVLLSPYSRAFHMMISNRWLRVYVSAGMIPLLLTMSRTLRDHFLRRYLRAICSDPDFSAAGRDFIPPNPEFGLENFSREMKRQRKVMLLGRSGLGKTTLARALCFHAATASRRRKSPAVGIPVFIAAGRHQEADPLDMFVAQLANYGDVHDEELVRWFLRQGGFLLCIDGLNEISATRRAKVTSLVDAIWRRNVVCVSSQQRYPEFAWLSTINLAPLSMAEMRQLVARHLDEHAVEKFFRQLTQASREIYSTPQNLLFGIRLLQEGRDLPGHRNHLYAAVFAPIQAQWSAAGGSGLAAILCSRAFDMLTLRMPYFEDSGFQASQMMVNDLLEHRLLARNADRLLFAHDLVQAYFAGRHFAQVWTEKAVWERKPDRNWLPMIEFCLEDLATAAEVAGLLEQVLAANVRLAGQVFQLIKVQRPSLLDSATEDSFLKRYAVDSLARHPMSE